jgi:hypothetical protein
VLSNSNQINQIKAVIDEPRTYFLSATHLKGVLYLGYAVFLAIEMFCR